MPLLYLAQSVEGRLTREGLREVGGALGITTAEVEAVASFYTMCGCARRASTWCVCTNLACALRGANEVYEAAHEAAGHRRTARSSPTTGCSRVHEEECLGVCEFAPAVQIDFANHDRVTPERMRRARSQALRAGEVPDAVARAAR